MLEAEGSPDLVNNLRVMEERRRDGNYVSRSLLPHLDSNRRHVTVAILKAKARYIRTPFETYCKYFEALLDEADRCGPSVDLRSVIEGTEFGVFYAVYSKMLGRESKLRRMDQGLGEFLGPDRADQKL